MIFAIIIYIIGCIIGYKLVMLDFKKSSVFMDSIAWFFVYLFCIFSWATVLAGLVINAVKGNFN